MTTKKQHKQKSVSPSDDYEIPELDELFWSNAVMGSPLKKQLISLRLDSNVIDWFRSRGPNYQTRMNAVLRTYMEWCRHETAAR